MLIVKETRDQKKTKLDVQRRQRAFKTLTDHARKAFCKTADVSIGTLIGHAVYAMHDTGVCVDAAIEMLEECNAHLSVAAINAIEKGRGQVIRKGRTLTIILPQHWDKI